jgi:2-phospho-L-lactate guanylyltransferase
VNGRHRHGTIDQMRWQVMIPIRPAGTGKTRLRGATEAALHADLVQALQRDALEAVLRARQASAVSPGSTAGEIAGVHVVTDPQRDADRRRPLPAGVSMIADGGGGLNAALQAGAAALAVLFPGDGIAALVGDLPALTASEFLDVLANAAAVPRGFVADHDATGTTMLLAGPGIALQPQFGPGSAQRHRDSGAVALAAGPGARSDVDTREDLQRCLRLGVGSHTSALVARLL